MLVAVMIIVVVFVSNNIDYSQSVRYVEKFLINSEGNNKSANVINSSESSDIFRETVDESVADKLKQRVRVLIWVMTSPKTVEKARAVKNTWGSRCDLLLFFSSENNTEIPIIELDVEEGREHLFEKTTQAFDYIYENYFDMADWFMKVDDDTFVVMENLRHFLYDKNASEPVFTGRHFHEPRLNISFESGGAGYVLSKEALRRFGTRESSPPFCTNETIYEDVEMARCLQRLGVSILNSTDNKLRSHFHPYDAESHVIKGLPVDYILYDANSYKVGMDAINEHAITFHYISPQQMHLLYYYTYHFRPFGISYTYS